MKIRIVTAQSWHDNHGHNCRLAGPCRYRTAKIESAQAVRVRDSIFGRLWAVNLVTVLPIDQIDDPALLRRLIRSMLILDGELNLPIVHRRLVEEACSLVNARYGALGVLNSDRTAIGQLLTVGLSEESQYEIGEQPTGLGILGLPIADPRPVRLADLTADPRRIGFPEHHPEMKSFLGVPVLVQGNVYATLYLTEKTDASEFSESDEHAAMALAQAAAIAIENARLHTAMREFSLTEDRDRIARDLHDSIIQRLFAVGLSLQGTARLTARPEVANRIGEAINSLDETIRQLRTAIFDLETTINRDGLRRKVYDLLLEMTPVLGTNPQVTFSGQVDSTVLGQAGDHMLTTLREALTNVGKHAGASHVVITIAVTDVIHLIVADDGRGLGANVGDGLGLKNMRRRAERLGGHLDLGASREGGTRLSWQIPLVPNGGDFEEATFE
jgi:signal transduction histidine kinase